MPRHKRMLAPINSIKHYVHQTATSIGTGTNQNVVLVDAIVKGAARANTNHVEEGAIIKAVYIELWLNGTADQTATWVLVKRPASVAAPTVAQMTNLATYENKKNILYSGQGITPSGGNQIPMFKGWFAVPKGKQRFGLGDILGITVNSTGGTAIICGISTYKEYE